jgi:hypothetical protein
MEIEKNENLVAEEVVTEPVAENVEVTTEETPKTYTEAEFNAKLDEVLGKKIARREAKIRKEYEKKYGDLEDVLRAGTGKDNVEDMTATFKDFYQKKGIKIQEKPSYSDRDIEVLARAEAEDIIRYGYDEVVEEVDRLAQIGVANMTAREKAVFKALAEHRQSAERGRELSKLGVTEDVYNSKEFSDFASKFNPDVPVSEIYGYYAQKQPKKDIKPMGSMKNTASSDNGVKDFYTVEEARRFTKKDYDKNPALFAAVEKSMQKWK